MTFLAFIAHFCTVLAISLCLIGMALFSEVLMIAAIPVAIIAVLLLLTLSFLQERY